ncbi:hypothetical protein [Variovorax sp. Sphag1AA]|uniref:hypothetical protein n=1 Tax=Variovorax sp. Sphag1AA TaxID=2587027 RepID=UPI001C8571E0|nr:hypothetical protein [Variovorax sp. Sphag1AA]
MATKNICDCPLPPGGEARCDIDQAAFCIVDEAGTIKTSCLSLPNQMVAAINGRNRTAVVSWMFHELSSRVDPAMNSVSPREALDFGVALLPSGPLPTDTVHFNFKSVGKRLGVRLPQVGLERP